MDCRLGISYGYESTLYSFPAGHPMNNSRTEIFASSLKTFSKRHEKDGRIVITRPVPAADEDLLLFHTQEYVRFVKEKSKEGARGYLDYGDTPSFEGVFEASLYPVGNTLNGLEMIINGKVDHFFNPVGGLHHARRERAGGFCVFNDSAIAIARAIENLKISKVAYIDIDAHHGDGVFYGFESDPRVIIGDIHEDGRFLYPGTGFTTETGKERALGTKMNFPLLPGSGDQEFITAFDKLEAFVRGFKPEFIFFQCGADGLQGDPITHLAYTSKAHAYASKKLHVLAHDVCKGRILAMGGGGYEPSNVDAAWSAVVKELSETSIGY